MMMMTMMNNSDTMCDMRDARTTHVHTACKHLHSGEAAAVHVAHVSWL